MRHIAKFNPYSMNDETILAVATGRKALLHSVLNTINQNQGGNSQQHLLIRGPRGMGKSFFMKYLQINFHKDERFVGSDIILLPEEQNNINSPSDLLRLIWAELNGSTNNEAITFWDEPEEIWMTELDRIKNYLAEKRKVFEKYSRGKEEKGLI